MPAKSKHKKDKMNTEIINRLSEKYKVSVEFVRYAVKGERTSTLATEIKKVYCQKKMAFDAIMSSK